MSNRRIQKRLDQLFTDIKQAEEPSLRPPEDGPKRACVAGKENTPRVRAETDFLPKPNNL